MVSTDAVPAALAVYFHQTDLPRGLPDCAAQPGVGSVVSVVAEKLSMVLENEAELTVVALAKLSLGGGAELFTTNASSEAAGPPPGGGLVTPILKLPPN